MANETIQVTPALYHYILNHSVYETEILKKLRDETREKFSAYRMQISPDQGQFLAFLIKLINAQSVLEIGTFTGYSALVMATALPETGRLITCDINLESNRVATRYWREAKVDQKIHFKLGEALQTLDQLGKEKYQCDFVFIDADKRNNQHYIEKVLPLLKVGGLIAVDNVLWGGSVADRAIQDETTAAIRVFNKHCYQDSRFDISLLPIADGLLLLRKK